MEVIVGSSFGIGMAAYVRDRSGVSAQDKALFLADESGHGGAQIGIGNRIGIRVRSNPPEDSSEDSSSSIGEGSENEEEEEEDDDAVSFQGGLDSFSSSLEDSLPIKRGLSNHYVGKSKSFGNLMEASKSNAKDLEKGENPYNKRRRLLIANKLRRRSLSTSVPLLALQETNEDEDVDDEILKLLEKRDLMAQTQSCFCLSSLQEEDDDDDDDDQ